MIEGIQKLYAKYFGMPDKETFHLFCICSHPGMFHHNYCFWEDDYEYSDSKKCECSEFRPENNLDYIEYEARRRGLIK